MKVPSYVRRYEGTKVPRSRNEICRDILSVWWHCPTPNYETVSHRTLKRLWFAHSVLSTISARKPAYGESPLIFELVREVAEAGKAAARVFCCSALDQATASVTKMTPDVHPYDYDLVVIGGGSGGLVRSLYRFVVPFVWFSRRNLVRFQIRQELLVCLLLF